MQDKVRAQLPLLENLVSGRAWNQSGTPSWTVVIYTGRKESAGPTSRPTKLLYKVAESVYSTVTAGATRLQAESGQRPGRAMGPVKGPGKPARQARQTVERIRDSPGGWSGRDLKTNSQGRPEAIFQLKLDKAGARPLY